jgi:hypothetical protein
MSNLLNRGLNFSILPLKLDITQVLVDYKRFERSTIWHEFWYGREQIQERKKPIFKTSKSNLPKNYTVPEGLKMFLGSVKSEILDPRNRNQTKCNLPHDQIQAIKELIRLQKEGVIIIKACDKGAGIIILNYPEYMRACYEHLLSVQMDENGEPQQYYKRVEDNMLQIAKNKIKQVLEEGYAEDIISWDEYKAMNPEDMDAAKFYCNFKVHKEHEPMTAPPPRPIISGSNSITKNIGTFVEHHIHQVAKQHDTYLQDSPHFLRDIRKLNRETQLEDNDILVTLDVKALFTNILHQDGLDSLKLSLEGRYNQDVPTDFILKLMDIILKYNIFTFHQDYFIQEIGAAMGSPPVPSYANIFMANKIDPQIRNIATKYNNGLKILRRYLDDFFLIFRGTTKKLHSFFEELNQIHQTIKLTINHTSPSSENEEDRCNCKPQSSIPFLDVLCSIKDRKIETDLYKKETDRNQYLLTSSCHPAQTCANIPFSLGLRIVRICSTYETRDQRLQELKGLLLSRGYSVRMIDSAIERARAIPRDQALRKVLTNKASNRPVFAVTFDPRLPSIPNIQAKHWRSMVGQDTYLAEVFKEPPLTAFRRQKNIRNHLIRALVPNISRPKRNLTGMNKCGKNCSACPYIKEGKSIKINSVNWKINKQVNCNSYNSIYAIQCKKDSCKKTYIGQSGRMLQTRLMEHRGYISNNDTSKATGEHFNLPGHSLSDLTVTILEQVKNNDQLYREEREHFIIRKLNTFYKGLNKQK